MDVRLPDGTIIRNVPEGTTQADLMGRVNRMRAEQGTAQFQDQVRSDLTGDMSDTEKFLAGAGKALTDIGRGAGQLVGLGPSGQEVGEQRQRDAPLMQTGAGLAGNVTGNVAALLPTAFVPGANTYLGAAAIGAGSGALQPTESGAERLQNIGLGAVAAPATLGAVRGATNAVRGVRAAVAPMTESGQQDIVGRLLRSAAGGQADDVAQRLGNARELVQGSQPTAAQVSQSGGIAALERAAAQANPESFAARQLEQNAARLNAVRLVAGSESKLAAAMRAREAAAGPLYRQAMTQGVDPAAAKSLQPQINNLIERMPRGVLERARDLARIEGLNMGPDGSVSGLHYVKMAIDDMLSSVGDSKLGKVSERALMTLKGDLLTVLDDLSPAYGQARQAFATASKPINQMQVGQALLNKLEPALTQGGTPIKMNAESFARALRDADVLAQRATGFEGARLDQVMTPRQMAALDAVRQDLARSATAQNLGRGAGSNTFQNLAQENLMQSIGVQNLPQMLSRPVQVTNYLLRGLYGSANKDMQAKIAEALLDPAKAAALMDQLKPSQLAQVMAAIGQRGEASLPALTAGMGASR